VNSEHPVIGPLYPDLVGDALTTGFSRFKSPGGIHGLAKVRPGEIEFLAVVSTLPGTGQFRKFIRECKTHYRLIRIWSVHSGLLLSILPRYGFVPGMDVDQFGGGAEVWDWKQT
jgi:hypothetical protein